MGYSDAKITCSASIIVSIIAEIYTIISESGLFSYLATTYGRKSYHTAFH